MRWRRLAASVWATETLSTKPMIEISSAGRASDDSIPRSVAGRVSGGSPPGTVPTIFTPASSSEKSAVIAIETATAATGAARVAIIAALAGTPAFLSSGESPLRAQKRKATEAAPISSVGRLISVIWAKSVDSSSGRVCPWASMPSRWRVCDRAISAAEAVMKPEITGCDRKLATIPSLSRPMASSITPERTARVTPASSLTSSVTSPSDPMAAAVISDTMATGPTASVAEVPKTA